MGNDIILLASDHAGYEWKEFLQQSLKGQDVNVQDLGCYTGESVDYPDYAHKLAKAISTGKQKMGVLLCGSANGVAITANKHKGVRAAICWNSEIAQLARQHNDANICCIPARYVQKEEALAIVQVFLTTAFEGGRHEKRVNKIDI
ncbi:MAG: ribose 5-phosphate isomerase B [Chitinophagales bacterium]|nr:ribose 5-phosphate isomerase B [Chitinophagales bacterium]